MVNFIFKSTSFRKKFSFLFLICITLTNFQTIKSKTCKESTSLTETDCFNNIIQINKDDSRHYRAGHFATNKNGDLIIEYSGDGPSDYRLFYAFRKNGRGYFDDNYIKEKQIVKSGNYNARYEARNIFVHLHENYDKEYLFSTSAYAAVVELHDLDNEQYLVSDTETFLGKRIFSYIYNILETKEDGKTIYFLFYTTPENNPGDDNGSKFVIKKLKFTEFKLDYTTSHITWKIDTNFNDRVISGFLFESKNAFGILFISKSDKTYVIRLFKYDLAEIGSVKKLYDGAMSLQEGYSRYLQAIYLKDDVVAFFYFHDYDSTNNLAPLKLQVLHFTITISTTSSYSTDDRLFIHWNDFSSLNSEITLNDIYKIDDDKLAFASTSSNKKLYILLLDFFNDYKSLKVRSYTFDTSYELNKEFQLYSYNGFLAFTSTINSASYNSILMFFGYPNGTDFEIDISPFIQNADDYSSSNNFYNTLYATKKIENNIFGYKNVAKIKLISIPEQLSFYPSSDNINTPLQNGSEIDVDSVLYENTELIKYSGYYYLDYQFMVEDITYGELCENAHKVFQYSESTNPLSYSYYGRK